jgi:hypothetical protein
MIATVLDKILLLGEFIFGIIIIIVVALISTRNRDDDKE